MKVYNIIISICVFSLLFSTTAYSQEDTQRIQAYLGGKFMIGYSNLSVGKYTTIANPSGPAQEGKIAQSSSLVRWGGGATVGVYIPIIPLIAMRTELEYIHARSAKTFAVGGETKLALNTNNLLINAYVDFVSLNSYVKPYISVGLGVGINELKYTPASINIGTATAKPVNFIAQSGIGMYILLGQVAFDINVRYLYNGSAKGQYINSNGDATRSFKSSPHMVEGLFSILIFI